MGLFKMVTAGAVGYVAYKAWQRRQGQASDPQDPRSTTPTVVGSTPPHGDPLRDSVGDARDRKQALGALAVFNENERTLAQLAVVKGVEGEVLAFARKMDEAHSAALTDLSRFAPDRNGTLGQAAGRAPKACASACRSCMGSSLNRTICKPAWTATSRRWPCSTHS